MNRTIPRADSKNIAFIFLKYFIVLVYTTIRHHENNKKHLVERHCISTRT